MNLAEEEKVLELATRRRIYDTVKKFAGSHFREIERKSGLASGSVKYHLAYLVRHGLISEEKDGNAVRYFPAAFDLKNSKLLGLLRQKSIRDILLFITTHKECNQELIVSFVKLSPSTVSWHMKKLEESNVISARKKGRKTFYALAIDRDDIGKLLITYQESFLDALVDRVVETWKDF